MSIYGCYIYLFLNIFASEHILAWGGAVKSHWLVKKSVTRCNVPKWQQRRIASTLAKTHEMVMLYRKIREKRSQIKWGNHVEAMCTVWRSDEILTTQCREVMIPRCSWKTNAFLKHSSETAQISGYFSMHNITILYNYNFAYLVPKARDKEGRK